MTMWKPNLGDKRLLIMFSGAVLGVFLLSDGLFRMTALASPLGASQTFQGGVAFTNYKDGTNIFTDVTNLVPGDTRSGTVSVVNQTPDAEYITFKTVVGGALFANNGKTGTTISSTYVSKDYAGTGDNPTYEYDDHPPELYDTAYVLGDQAATTQSQGPFSSTVKSGTFVVPSEGTLVINYTLDWPLVAHNDYQGATGQMQVFVKAVEDPNYPVPPPKHPNSPPGNPLSPPPNNPPPSHSTPPPKSNTPPPSGSVTPNTPKSPPTTPPTKTITISEPGKGNVVGATKPVTGLPFFTMLGESITMMGLGAFTLWLAFRRKKPR